MMISLRTQLTAQLHKENSKPVFAFSIRTYSPVPINWTILHKCCLTSRYQLLCKIRMSFELVSECLIHDIFFNELPVQSRFQRAILTQFESLSGSQSINDQLFSRFAFILLALKVVLACFVHFSIGFERSQVKIAQKSVGLVQIIELDYLLLHVSRKSIMKPYWHLLSYVLAIFQALLKQKMIYFELAFDCLSFENYLTHCLIKSTGKRLDSFQLLLFMTLISLYTFTPQKLIISTSLPSHPNIKILQSAYKSAPTERQTMNYQLFPSYLRVYILLDLRQDYQGIITDDKRQRIQSVINNFITFLQPYPIKMSYSPESNTGTNVKIHPYNPVVTDIEGFENRTLERIPESKSKNSIKLNPIPQIPINLQDRERQRPSPMDESIGPMRTMRKETSQTSGNSPTRLNKKVKKGYELADYSKALDYLHSMSYRKKVKNPNENDPEYEPIDTCGPNDQLKEYGLGVYLYFEFIKRLAITLFIMSALLIFPLVTAYQDTGLDTYNQSSSFTMTLAKFTLGNINSGNQRTYLIMTVSDVLSMLVLFIFTLHWRSFHKSVVEEAEKDHQILNPTSYVVSIDGIHDETSNIKTLEAELKAYMDTLYKGAYEVEVVFNYQGNFDKFMAYDEQIEIVEKETQIIRQTNKETKKLVEEEEKLLKMEEDIQHTSQAFEPMYAIIHFRTLKAKLAFLNHCKRFKLVNTTGAAISRALCCTPTPPEKFLFLGKFPLYIRNNKLSRPEEINWRNIDLSSFSIFLRWVLSIILVVVSIIITSAMIGFCTLYVASTSSCQNYTFTSTGNTQTDTTLIAAMGSSAKYCYCNENLASMYTDTYINTLCSSISSMVLMTNALQIGASILSSVTNAILGILISVIAKKLLRPNTIPKEYVFVFWGVLFSNFINSCLIPLLLNANIFGVQFVSYLKFIDFMDFSKMSIFNDFTTDWYALVSPYYLNMVIISAFISPIIGLVITAFKNCLTNWSVKSMCENKDKEEPVIQKEANSKITSFTFLFAEETSQIVLFLLISVMYSGLIPLLIPVYGLGLVFWYVCKRAIVVKYSVKVPADETLNESVIFALPFIILAHALFSVWSHTANGVFDSNSPLVKFSWTFLSGDFNRIFNDVIILAQAVFIVVMMVMDYTLLNFFGWLAECCKDELEMPVQFAAIENQQFSDRLQKSNILGSYKLINNPNYGHALKAYNELAFRQKGNEETKDEFNPERFD